MNKVYHLANCDTCQRIIAETGVESLVCTFQNIKTDNIGAEALDSLAEKVGSYEALFSKRAMKYKEWGLNKMQLTEVDYRRYILEEYTFLKRPVFILGEQIFVGNAPKTVTDISKTIAQLS
jgi:arsenate reductase (glutaredoxin)